MFSEWASASPTSSWPCWSPQWTWTKPSPVLLETPDSIQMVEPDARFISSTVWRSSRTSRMSSSSVMSSGFILVRAYHLPFPSSSCGVAPNPVLGPALHEAHHRRRLGDDAVGEHQPDYEAGSAESDEPFHGSFL